MTLRIPAKVLIHVWSYDFYDMTLSTGKQRHMIKKICICEVQSLFLGFLSMFYLSSLLSGFHNHKFYCADFKQDQNSVLHRFVKCQPFKERNRPWA